MESGVWTAYQYLRDLLRDLGGFMPTWRLLQAEKSLAVLRDDLQDHHGPQPAKAAEESSPSSNDTSLSA